MSSSSVQPISRAGSRPAGQITRGFTAPNRLRKADAYLTLAHEHEVRTATGLIVDLGFGRVPVTTIEMARRLSRVNPRLQVLGVEIDRERVTAATAMQVPRVEFRFGGFNLPLMPGERASIVRAMNVLRQYDELEVAAALSAIATAVTPGGLLLEGTSNPPGRLLTLNVFRRLQAPTFALEEVVFATKPTPAFSPRQFQAVLPKTLIHHAEPGGPLDQFFERWERAWLSTAGSRSSRGRFARAASLLSDSYLVDRRPGFARRGMLVLRPPWPQSRHKA